MEQKTYYYSDELNDEFSGITRDKIEIGESFKFVSHNFLWNLASFIVYRFFVFPYGVVYMKLVHHLKIVNKQVFKKARKNGYFVYANHTNVPSDGFLPSILTFPKREYVVVSSENLAVKGTKNLMQMIGAIPLPTKIKGMRGFINALDKRISQKKAITIYPEAHIWPYYTKIRNFKPDSFSYPCKFKVPCFCFTVTYQKRKHSEKPKMTVYCDGPFYPDESLCEIEQRQKLRDEVYKTMVNRSANSTYEYYHYVKKED